MRRRPVAARYKPMPCQNPECGVEHRRCASPYCSDACREVHLDALAAAEPPALCEHCHAEHRQRRPRTRELLLYCSPECAIDRHRVKAVAWQRERRAVAKANRTGVSHCRVCCDLPHRRPEDATCPGCGEPWGPDVPIARPDPWDRGASPLGAASDQAIGVLGIGQSSAAAKAMKTPGKDTSAWAKVRGNSPSHRAAK